MPRINRAIDLLERGDTLYYTAAGELTYEHGRTQAQTWADFLLVDFEHEAFDIVGLTAFMRGLVDGGPTADGYRTPTVIATLPSNCRTADEVRANAWQIRQVLTAGVHGVLHTHARRADAVAAFVAECRYAGVETESTPEGQRGAGGQKRPAAIWGLSPVEYIRRASPWPFDPAGELLLGVKIEDQKGLAVADEIVAVPGIAFAEWGPGDMGLSFGYPDAHDPPYPPEMEAARLRVKAACDASGLAFLSSWNDPNQSIADNIRFLRDWGVRIISPGPAGEEWARVGRSL